MYRTFAKRKEDKKFDFISIIEITTQITAVKYQPDETCSI